MRIERVTVAGFGPLRNQVLDLVPGLTVVTGGNESAKSSWHAATYAALCGMRRGQGLHDRDRAFRRRHQPWDGGPWRVDARVVLDDGRVIDLSQELADRVDCRALDVGLGRDVTNEIRHEGTPDASRWLGLNRRAFEATACIRQAELLRVREAGGDLGELLGQAAATSGADESAARALLRIADFQRDHVGTERANAVKPLRRAIDAQAEAQQAYDEAVELRLAFDQQAAQVESLRSQAAASSFTWQTARAARLRADADALAVRAERAQSLADELGPERPSDAVIEHQQVSTVTAALAGWSARPRGAETGDDPDAIRAALAELPLPPTLDTAVDSGTAAAYGGYRAAVATLAALGAAPAPSADRRPSKPAWWSWLVVAAGVAFGGIGLAVSQLVVAALGAVAAVVGLVLAFRRPALGSASDRRAAWKAARTDAERAVSASAAVLRASFADRGVACGDDGDLERAYLSYEERCAAARDEAAAAAQRPVLEERLRAAELASARRADELTAQSRAATGLREAARLVGFGDLDGSSEVGEDATAVALEGWLASQRTAAQDRQRAQRAWTDLDRVSGDGDIASLRERARAAAAQAQAAAVGLGDADLAAAVHVSDEELADLERQAREGEQEVARQEGRLRQFGADLPDVSLLEERLWAARAERNRVEQLKTVLERTAEFMAAAQERVHRDIAPRLQSSLVRWLSVVTEGRYVDAVVDPQTLAVRVCGQGRQWREADLLSFGTAEQVYLLLRLALVEHLTAEHDTCPLLLDDVTVHGDSGRTEAILELLLSVSRERQVVLFTQEAHVADWARERLVDVPGGVVTLEPVSAT
jgi:hypothetical protein